MTLFALFSHLLDQSPWITYNYNQMSVCVGLISKQEYFQNIVLCKLIKSQLVFDKLMLDASNRYLISILFYIYH